LPQRFLGNWLGLSRELLAQEEIGNREIPHQARLIFFELQKILESLPEGEPEFCKPYTDDKLARKLRQKIRLLKHQFQRDENKIISLKELMDKQKRAILFCQILEKSSFVSDILAQKVIELFLLCQIRFNEICFQ
jgi:hypothetical protein